MDDDDDDDDDVDDDDDDDYNCHQVWSSPVDDHRGEVRRHLGQRPAGNLSFFFIIIFSLRCRFTLISTNVILVFIPNFLIF